MLLSTDRQTTVKHGYHRVATVELIPNRPLIAAASPFNPAAETLRAAGEPTVPEQVAAEAECREVAPGLLQWLSRMTGFSFSAANDHCCYQATYCGHSQDKVVLNWNGRIEYAVSVR